MLCDLYTIWDLEQEIHHLIYTVAQYYIPESRGKLIETNVPCPCNDTSYCVRKCCLPDDTMGKDKKCKNTDLFEEQKIAEIKSALNFYDSSNYSFIYGSVCNTVIKPLNFSSHAPVEEYCTDYFSDVKEYMTLQCTPDDYKVNEISRIYTICLTLSIFFLVVTFAVYFFIENLRNLPGKILLGYVASLLITDIFFMLLQTLSIVEGTFCILSGYIIHFSFLASFFWLNVMCFDLWWAFSRYRSFNGLCREKDRKKFLLYCLYSWGSSLLITTITFVMDHIEAVPESMKPKIGEINCWLKDYSAQFYYFYSFISVILIINFIMFIETTIIIIKHRQNESKFLKGEDSKRHDENEKRRFYIYLKLYSIMGVNWLMEILSYYYQQESIIWDVMDICNTLQGTMIFVIFVCKRKVLVLLNKKIYPERILLKDNSRCNSNSIHSNIGSGRMNCSILSRTEMSVIACRTESDQSDFIA